MGTNVGGNPEPRISKMTGPTMPYRTSSKKTRSHIRLSQTSVPRTVVLQAQRKQIGHPDKPDEWRRKPCHSLEKKELEKNTLTPPVLLTVTLTYDTLDSRDLSERIMP